MASRKQKHKTNPGDRGVVNLCTMLVTLCAIGVVMSVADGSLSQSFNEINRRLDFKLGRVLEEVEIDYEEIDINATYYSKTNFNPKGMGGLYNLTKMFMNVIIPENFLPPGVISITPNNVEIDMDYIQNNSTNIAGKLAGLIVLLLIFALMLVFFPLCGLCFCCCRCCGNCGARSQPFDKKNDCCRKFILATFLIIAGTLLLFGVVCAFVSNQQVQEGTEELPRNLKTALKDTNTYLSVTNQQLTILLVRNYGEFQKTLFRTLDNTSTVVFEELEEMTNATTMSKITEVASDLDKIQTHFKSLTQITKELRVDASQLNDALRKVKYDLIQTLNQCTITECSELMNQYINKLDTDIDFNTIPDISSQSEKLEEVLNKNIVEDIKKGQEALDQVKIDIGNKVSTQLIEVKDSITKAGHEVTNSLSNVTKIIDQMNTTILSSTNNDLDQADTYIQKYSPYRYYVGIAMSSVLLLVAICVALGLICGICGKRPDSYSDDCCNKGAGSRFLMCGVGIMFLFAIVLVVLTFAYFILGITSERVICNPLQNPNENDLIKMVDQFINFNEVLGLNVTVSSVIKDCHDGNSIYNVLKLESKFDLNRIKNFWEEYHIDDKLDELKQELGDNNDLGSIVLLSDGAAQSINDLIEADISSNFDPQKFIDEVSGNFTTANLDIIKDKIKAILDLAETEKKLSVIKGPLQLSLLHIETYQEKLINPMKTKADKVKDIAVALNQSLRIGDQPFEEGLKSLKEETLKAQEYLNKDGPEILRNIANNYTVILGNIVQGFLQRIVDNVQKKVGNCAPLSQVFRGVLTSTCDKIIQPVNGFWFGVFWSLILFIPIIILSVKLATLYQKYDPYPGSMVEAEYLYDAYADRENIPLSGIHAKHGKKRKNKKSKRYERGNSHMLEAGDQGRDYPTGSHHQDARYADMAPKHWEDFPANGPPQYQRAPTEYDRPPPYYYPGTAEAAPPPH